MLRRVLFLSILAAVLLSASPASAQGPVEPKHSDPTWQAAYWNNPTLSGAPVLQRAEANLDYDWGSGSPDAAVPADGFSARWSRYLELQAGTYRFTATSDDGMRVYLDDKKILDSWYDHPPQSVSADVSVGAGHHLAVVEYYENRGAAVARLSWAPVSAPKNWRGEYFDNVALGGPPALVRDDAEIRFSWGAGSPAPQLIGVDQFSVRWTRTLTLPAGTYRFRMMVDDGGRLWVNNHLLIDGWKDQGVTAYRGDLYVPGGGVPVRMEFYENYGDAVAQLSWTQIDSQQPEAVIVDDVSQGFVKGGRPAGWRTEPEGYNGHLTWTQNNNRVRPKYNWARWYPRLEARSYEVLVWIPDRYSTTTKARYWISHANGSTLKLVNQSANGKRWVSLGTYRFQGNKNDYVSLSDVTYEPYLSRLIAFDAVKWVPR